MYNKNGVKINLGYSDKIPVYSNPDAMLNGSIALIGGSGSGKSIEAQRIISCIVEKGGTVVVISQHGSFTEDQIFSYYKPIINDYRNDIYAYDDGIPVHLFDPVEFSDGTMEQEIDMIGSIVDIISRALHLGIRQKEVLRTAIQKVRERGTYLVNGFSAIGDALGGGSSTKINNELYDRMQYLFRHNVFVDGDGLIKQNAINVIHLDKLDLSLQEVVCEMLLAYIWRLANADQFKVDGGIYLFIDECQNASTNSKSPLALMLSEGRRMGINLILATQMILQSTTNSVQQRISQCGLILYFRPAASRISMTARLVSSSASAKWEEKLRGLKKGSFIATGEFLFGNKQVDYPLLVTADVGEIAVLDKEYKLF